MSKRYVAPSINEKDPMSLKRAVEKVYDDLNSLADATAKTSDESASRTEGEVGNTRVVEDKGKDELVLQARTKDGWVTLQRKNKKESFE